MTNKLSVLYFISMLKVQQKETRAKSFQTHFARLANTATAVFNLPGVEFHCRTLPKRTPLWRLGNTATAVCNFAKRFALRACGRTVFVTFRLVFKRNLPVTQFSAFRGRSCCTLCCIKPYFKETMVSSN